MLELISFTAILGFGYIAANVLLAKNQQFESTVYRGYEIEFRFGEFYVKSLGRHSTLNQAKAKIDSVCVYM